MASWGDLLRDGNPARAAVVGGGMFMHAMNTFIATTILPSVVRDIGGLQFFAWATTLYVVASLLGGAVCARVLARHGARTLYRFALASFAVGAVFCALAPNMAVLLLGRTIQGLGAGTLSALSFTLVRALFPEALWARALSLVSGVWGIATLAGPALGGIFAQYGAWRLGFWTTAGLAPLLLILVEVALPRSLARPPTPKTPMAVGNLTLLAASALCVSAGSSQTNVTYNAIGLAAAVAGFLLFTRLEARGRRLLPLGACNPLTPLGATYAAMLTLIIGINPEIFVPYFLQVLHGTSPISAGYISAIMSAGWTLGSVGGSTQTQTARALLAAGPLLMAASLISLAILMPTAGASMPLIAALLLAQGLGIGLCWPHLGANVFKLALDTEKDLAAGSMTVVIMVSNAFGSALGGMVTNLAGLTDPGGPQGATSASAWLFSVFAAGPVLAFAATLRLRGFPRRITSA